MKHSGDILHFTCQRNRELLSAYRKIIDKCNPVDINSVAQQLADTPCSRFWVSEERALAVVSAIMRGRNFILDSMRPLKREMFLEIHARVLSLQKEQPDAPLRDLVFLAVNSPAPKFYMMPSFAIDIIYDIKKRGSLTPSHRSTT